MNKYCLILMLAFLLYGCKKNNDCIIPKNSKIVISVDFVGLADETDLVDSSLFDLICRFLNTNPLKMGIDFSEPLMLFELEDGRFGATMAIDDEEELTECLIEYARDNIATMPRSNDGLTWSKLLGEAHLAYNGKTLLLLLNGDYSDSNTKRIMKELFQLDYEDTFYSTNDYERMYDIKGKDVVMYANLSALSEDIIGLYKTILPKGVKCSDIETVSSFNSEDGQLVVKTELFSDDEKAQQMIDEHEKAIKPINGKYMDVIPKEAVVTVMAGIEGNKLYEIIKSIPQLSKQITMAEVSSGIDLCNRVRNSDDDIMLCFDKDEPLCLLLDGEEFNISDRWTKGKVEPFPIGRDEVTKYSVFVYIDLDKIDNNIFTGGIPVPSVYKCMNNLNAVTVCSEGKGDITMTLHSNSSENFLKQLFQ